MNDNRAINNDFSLWSALEEWMTGVEYYREEKQEERWRGGRITAMMAEADGGNVLILSDHTKISVNEFIEVAKNNKLYFINNYTGYAKKFNCKDLEDFLNYTNLYDLCLSINPDGTQYFLTTVPIKCVVPAENNGTDFGSYATYKIIWDEEEEQRQVSDWGTHRRNLEPDWGDDDGIVFRGWAEWED